MKPHAIAALVALLALGLTLGVSALVSRERPKHPGQSQVVAEAVAALAPSAAGQPCPNVARLMPIRNARIADALLRSVKRTPDAVVAAPSGQGEVRLADVPSLLAKELEQCLAATPNPGPGWERLVVRLKG